MSDNRLFRLLALLFVPLATCGVPRMKGGCYDAD